MKVAILTILAMCGLFAGSAGAQTDPTRTKTLPAPTPTKSPTPEEYSRQSQGIITGSGSQDQAVIDRLDRIASQLQTISRRLDRLEGQSNSQSTQSSKDDKSKSLLTSLDIITKGEQRVESLRRQLFEVMDKESSLRAKIDQLEIDARPENIDRNLAFSGSLRPEELRDARRKAIEAERKNAQLTLVDIQSLRSALEGNLTKAETLVEKLRQKFEKDIDSALTEN